jgi:4-diphosphocytidyl-2-C-methyl-D-erythritol kinase
MSTLQVIDLGDDMEFKKLGAAATRDMLSCSDPTIPSDDSNLVVKVRANLI